MSAEDISAQVECSWTPSNDKVAKEAVVLCPLSTERREEDGSLTDMVNLDTCLCLTQPSEQNGNQDSNSTACSITIKLVSTFPCNVDSVTVISEARVIEVYGVLNEYLLTVHADLLDEMDGTAVFCANIKLKQLTQECTIKFARLARPSDMWLFGIKVMWDRLNVPYNSINHTSRVNFDVVEQFLKESPKQLSEKAENYKRFLKLCGSLKDCKNSETNLQSPLALMSLLSSFGKEANRKGNSSEQNVKENSSQQNGFQLPGAAEASTSTQEGDKEICQSCSRQLEGLIQRQLLSLEGRLMRAFDERISVLQQHQERQLQILLTSLLKSPGISTFKFKPDICDYSSFIGSQDHQIEQAVKKLIDQARDVSNGDTVPKKASEKANDNLVLQNVLKALELNEIQNGLANSNRMGINGSTVFHDDLHSEISQ